MTSTSSISRLSGVLTPIRSTSTHEVSASMLTIGKTSDVSLTYFTTKVRSAKTGICLISSIPTKMAVQWSISAPTVMDGRSKRTTQTTTKPSLVKGRQVMRPKTGTECAERSTAHTTTQRRRDVTPLNLGSASCLKTEGVLRPITSTNTTFWTTTWKL